jgi:hypothetical protein
VIEYYFENFESYSGIFSEHALYISELMKLLDDQIISMGLPPVGRTKDLFRMVLDLSYHVDQTYKKRHNLEEPTFKLTTYMSKDDVISEMRNLLKEELTRYMGHVRDAEQ